MGILQARVLKWVAMPSSRGAFQPRDRTQVSHIAGGFLPAELPGKPQYRVGLANLYWLYIIFITAVRFPRLGLHVFLHILFFPKVCCLFLQSDYVSVKKQIFRGRETCMQVRKQQLELDMGQQTGSKEEKEYVKAVYCHPAYLTYMQSTS